MANPYKRFLTPFILALAIVLTSFAVPAGAQNVGDDVPTDPVQEDSTADEGRDGTDNACIGDCAGGDAGNAGDPGISRKGNSAGRQGQQTEPATPEATTDSEAAPSSSSRAAANARRRAGARSSSGAFSDSEDGLQTILLYPETATPLPDPFLPSTESVDESAIESEAESQIEEPSDSRPEPVEETASGGSPVRRVIGILAALVAVGSAWSLLSQGRSRGRSRAGRRSIGRAPRRL